MKLFATIWRNYSEDGLKFLDSVDVTDNIEFSTQLHGGFSVCSFVARGREDESFRRYRLFLGAHVVIMDDFSKRVWEGFIDKTSLSDNGVKCNAMGYYAKGKNLFFDNIYVAVEGTQNLIENPSFEVNVTDFWTFSSGTGGSRAQVTTDGKYGTDSCALTQPTSGADTILKATITVTGSTDYALTFYAKDVDSSNVPYVKITENGTGTPVTERTIYGLSKDVWVRYELKVTTVSDTTSLDIEFGVVANSANGVWRLDAVMFEQKPYSTEYCDGDQGTYHAWDGTAHNSTSTRSSFNYTVYDIVKDIVDFVPEWEQTYGLLSRATYGVGTHDFTGKKANDALETVLGYGYQEADIRPIYFAIWENRQAFLFPEPYQHGWVDWKVSTDSIVGGSVGLENSLQSVFNKIYAVYDNTVAGVSLTLPAENKFSQNRYGVIEGKVNNGTTPEGIALAEDIRDLALEKFAFPQQIFSIEISGFVRNAAERIDLPYKMRAGQRLLITDLEPMTTLATDFDSQNERGMSGFIVKTQYSASSRTMKIDLGLTDVSFEVLMGRLGLSGGLT